MVNTEQLDAVIAVPEKEIQDITIGQSAIVSIAAGRLTVSGRVREKAVVVNAASRSYDVKIRLEANNKLLPGMVAEVSIDCGNAAEENIVVPVDIVQLGDDNSHFVWTVDEGRACRREVEIGQFTAQCVVVSRGLREGDVVIIAGQQKVCNGTIVEL